ncbi:39S ribosomal protein L20, mitochondrial [Toxocara canis]|uniref:39S ribosomal protein L20, mitochondrial n=1 Tax=Toxocara canis TaxID=6265 RepID=A0A0B2VIL0_TOXCA|nr:39S ribosomal protein L20, mitochondrial [Toxocara canis]
MNRRVSEQISRGKDVEDVQGMRSDMRLSELVCLRRIIDSPYHPFQVIPKPDRWPSRERLRRFIADMRLSELVCLRRIIDSPYHPFQVIPKPDRWPSRERLRRFIAWQYGSERTTVRGGYRKQNKLFHYMTMQREDAPKLEKFYAEERVKAALAEHHFEYAPFRNMLDKAHILLDNVVLSQLAIYEPKTFKWQYGSERTTVRGGYRKQNKLFHYMTMQREDAPKLEKFYAEERVKAALAEHHFEYAPFRNMLDKAHILLDNVVLSQLAIYEPKTFKSLVMLTKQMAQEEGRAVITDPEQRYIETEFSLFGTPFPRARIFPRGPAENHKIKPRKLKRSEY